MEISHFTAYSAYCCGYLVDKHMIEIYQLTKSYGAAPVLHIPELHIPSGIHWIQGKNGAGKTTLFRALAGLLPFSGEVLLNGLSIRKQPVAYRMLVNYGEAEPLYPAFLTGRDILHFVGKAKKASREQLDETVEQLQMQQFYQHPCGTYSSGMLKKLSLALAFLGQPRVIMLDEPLITIDGEAVHAIYDMIRHYHRQQVTFLLSSHQDLDFQELPVCHHYLVSRQTVQQIT